jgi:spore germination protein (amino acid permease)
LRDTVKENLLVSPVIVFFLIYSSEPTTAVWSFQQHILQKTGYDGWMTVLITGLSIHILIWMMYKILNNADDDIIGIHRKLFGKWIGGILSFSVILYFVVIVLVSIRLYIAVIQVWIFPHLSTWVYTGAILILAYYYVSGGFRTVAGICVLSMIYTVPLIVLTCYFPLEYAHYSNLLPFMAHSGTDIFLATKDMVPSYTGFELLLIFYPFIKNAKKSQKWAHYGNLLSTTIFLLLAIVSFVYYSEKQLSHLPWPTLTFWKIAQFPFIERFETIGIAWWLFAILPNVCLALWGASRGIKRLFSVNQRHTLFVIVFTIFVCSGWFEGRMDMKMLKSITDQSAFYFFYLYIPLLFVVQWFVDKLKR